MQLLNLCNSFFYPIGEKGFKILVCITVLPKLEECVIAEINSKAMRTAYFDLQFPLRLLRATEVVSKQRMLRLSHKSLSVWCNLKKSCTSNFGTFLGD